MKKPGEDQQAAVRHVSAEEVAEPDVSGKGQDAAARARGAEEARSQVAEDQNDRTEFCRRCLDQSTSQSPWFVSTFNGFGARFYGSAEKCPKCFSVVRVLWLTFAFIPVIPLGCYRHHDLTRSVLAHLVGGSVTRRFIARKTKKTRWLMVFTHWLVLGAVMIVLALMRSDPNIFQIKAPQRLLTDDERAEVQKSMSQARERAEVAQKAWRGAIEQAVGNDVVPKANLGECPIDVPRPSTTSELAPTWLNRIKGPLPNASSNWTMEPNASSNWLNSYRKSAENIDPNLALDAKMSPAVAARLLEDAKMAEALEVPWEVTFLVEEEVEPVAQEPTYEPGSVVGRAYLYDYRTKRVECAGRVLAKSSDRVKFKYNEVLFPNGARFGGDKEFRMALLRDLRISTYRQVAASIIYRAGPGP